MSNRGLADKLAEIRRAWRDGRYYGYPRCCIAAYCWDSIWSLPPSLTRCVSQRVESPGSHCDWVPCGVFHHGGSGLAASERIRRILAFWWSTLRPTSAVWRRSQRDRLIPRPPYLPLVSELAWDPASAVGPTEDAFDEVDTQRYDRDLDWS